jgi:hypothetical protein
MALAVAVSLDQTASFFPPSDFDRIKSYAQKYSTTRLPQMQKAHEICVGQDRRP